MGKGLGGESDHVRISGEFWTRDPPSFRVQELLDLFSVVLLLTAVFGFCVNAPLCQADVGKLA